MTPKRILIPVDFTECSQFSLRLGLQLAQAFDANVDVLHAWTAPEYVSPYSAVLYASSPDGQASIDVIARAESSRRCRKMIDEAMPKGHQNVGLRIEYGAPVEVIRAAAPNYDLVVLGTHRRRGLARFALGSVAQDVLRTIDTPVLVVPGDAQWTPSKLIVPVDFTEAAKHSLSAALEWARALDVPVEAVHAAYPIPNLGPQAELHKRLQRWTEENSDGHPVETRMVFGAPELILAHAETDGAMRFMATHGRTGLDRVMHGSVAEATVRQSDIPTWIVHTPPEPTETAEVGFRAENVYGLFEDSDALYTGLRALREAGVPTEEISLVLNETMYREVASVHERTRRTDGVEAGALFGGAIGGVAGLLAVIGSVAPPVALIVLGHALSMAAAGGLLGGLLGWGVPSEAANRIEAEVGEGRMLIVVRGHSKGDVARALEVMTMNGGEVVGSW